MVAVGEQPQGELDPLRVVLSGSHELLHRQGRARDYEEGLEGARKLVEGIGGD